MDEIIVKRCSDIFKALAHETRVRIVEILGTEGDKCVCELVDMLGFDQTTISKHLAVLKNAGIVRYRKEGLKMIYSLNLLCAYNFIKCIGNLEGSSCIGGGMKCDE